MKLNNKGISLAEVLASIVIIGIISTSAIFAIQSRGKQLKIINDEFEVKFKLTDASNRFFLTNKDEYYGEHVQGTLTNVKTTITVPEVLEDIEKQAAGISADKNVIVSYVQEDNRWYTILRTITINENDSGNNSNKNEDFDEAKIPLKGPDYPFTQTVTQDDLTGFETIDEELLANAKTGLLNKLNTVVNQTNENKQYFSLGKYGNGSPSSHEVTSVDFIDIQIKNTVGNKDNGYPVGKRFYSFYCLLNINSNPNNNDVKDGIIAVYGGFKGTLINSIYSGQTVERLQVDNNVDSKYPINDNGSFRPRPRGSYTLETFYKNNTDDSNYKKVDTVRLAITDMIINYLNGEELTISQNTAREVLRNVK